MSDADKAAARVEAFLPELAYVPDESRAARLGAQQLADDIRTVFDDRELLRAAAGQFTRDLDEARWTARFYRDAYHDGEPFAESRLGLLPGWLIPLQAEPTHPVPRLW